MTETKPRTFPHPIGDLPRQHAIEALQADALGNIDGLVDSDEMYAYVSKLLEQYAAAPTPAEKQRVKVAIERASHALRHFEDEVVHAPKWQHDEWLATSRDRVRKSILQSDSPVPNRPGTRIEQGIADRKLVPRDSSAVFDDAPLLQTERAGVRDDRSWAKREGTLRAGRALAIPDTQPLGALKTPGQLEREVSERMRAAASGRSGSLDVQLAQLRTNDADAQLSANLFMQGALRGEEGKATSGKHARLVRARATIDAMSAGDLARLEPNSIKLLALALHRRTDADLWRPRHDDFSAQHAELADEWTVDVRQTNLSSKDQARFERLMSHAPASVRSVKAEDRTVRFAFMASQQPM